MSTYRDLIAWQKGLDLVEAVYLATEDFPQREWYGLAAQMRKAAVSIPANLAEGHAYRRRGYRHHVRISIGSHSELRTEFDLAGRLHFLDASPGSQLFGLMDEVGRLTQALSKSLRAPEDDVRPGRHR
jgi:four helix bundle protein